MKNETKHKILSFVRRLLRYDPTKEIAPWIEIETRKILLIRSRQFYKTAEMGILSKEQIEYFAQMQLVSELHKEGLIVYSNNYDPEAQGYFVVADIKAIYP